MSKKTRATREEAEEYNHRLERFENDGPFTKDEVVRLCREWRKSYNLDLTDVLVECIFKFPVEELVKLRDMPSDERKVLSKVLKDLSVVEIVQIVGERMELTQLEVFKDTIDWQRVAENEWDNIGRLSSATWKEVFLFLRQHSQCNSETPEETECADATDDDASSGEEDDD